MEGYTIFRPRTPQLQKSEVLSQNLKSQSESPLEVSTVIQRRIPELNPLDKERYNNKAFRQRYSKISRVKSNLAVSIDKATLVDIFANPKTKQKFLPNMQGLRDVVKKQFEDKANQRKEFSKIRTRTLFYKNVHEEPPILPEDTEFGLKEIWPKMQNLLKCIAGIFPWLLVRIIETQHVNSQGVYGVWLNMTGIWKLVVTKESDFAPGELSGDVIWFDVVLKSLEKYLVESNSSKNWDLDFKQFLKLLTGGAVFGYNLDTSNLELRDYMRGIVQEKERRRSKARGMNENSDPNVIRRHSSIYYQENFRKKSSNFLEVEFEEEIYKELRNSFERKWPVFATSRRFQRKCTGVMKELLFPIISFDPETTVMEIGDPFYSSKDPIQSQIEPTNYFNLCDFVQQFDELIVCRIQPDDIFTSSTVKFNIKNPLVETLNYQSSIGKEIGHTETRSLQALFKLQIWQDGEYIIDFTKEKDPMKIWKFFKATRTFKVDQEVNFNSSITLGYMNGERGMKFVDSKFDSEGSTYIKSYLRKGEFILLVDLRYEQEDWDKMIRFGHLRKIHFGSFCWNRIELANINLLGPASASLVEVEQDLEGVEDLDYYFGFFQHRIWRHFAKYRDQILHRVPNSSDSLLSPLSPPSWLRIQVSLLSKGIENIPAVIPRLKDLSIKVETFMVNHLIIVFFKNIYNLGVTFEIEVTDLRGYEVVIPNGEKLDTGFIRINIDPFATEVIVLRYLEGNSGFKIESRFQENCPLKASSVISENGEKFINSLR